MAEQKFEIIPGTETNPPQIINEHLASDVDQDGGSPSAQAVVNAWYAEHEQKLAAEKEAEKK